MPTETPTGAARPAWPLAAALGALAALPYLGALACGLVYDDLVAIRDNPVVTGPLDLGRVLTTGFWGQGAGGTIGAYRPLTVLTFALDHAAGGGAPWVFHLANLLWHALATAALFLVLDRRAGRLAAGLAAALFAVHAVHTENVAGLVGRADVLATLLGLAAWELARARRLAVALLAGPALLLALLAKEVAVAFAALVVLEALLRLDPARGGRPARRLAVWGALGLAVAAYLALRLHALGALAAPVDWRSNPLVEAGAVERVWTAGALLARAVGLLVAPLTLSADYSWAEIPVAETPWRADVLAGLALWVALPAGALALRRRAPAVALGLLVLVVAWAPVSNLVLPVPTIFGERLLYLPSAGFCLAVGAALAPLAARPGLRRPLLAAFGVLVAAHGARAAVRTGDWASQRTLFEAAVSATPGSARAWYNLGIVELEEGRLDRSARYLALAETIAPRWPAPAASLGIALDRAGDPEAAHGAFRRAFDRAPACAECATNLARFYLKYGRPAEAEAVVAGHAAAGGAPGLVARLRAEVARRRGGESPGAGAPAPPGVSAPPPPGPAPPR